MVVVLFLAVEGGGDGVDGLVGGASGEVGEMFAVVEMVEWRAVWETAHRLTSSLMAVVTARCRRSWRVQRGPQPDR
ncbi:hypothetical protein GCM10009646_87110 [Streptomyces aureus]